MALIKLITPKQPPAGLTMVELTFEETRVIGVLMEKQTTTPDQYPMSLNSLTNACNQKSNRDPVTHFSEGDVQNVLDEMEKKHLVAPYSTSGSRVVKYQHRFANTEFSKLQFNKKQRAVLCVLFLRGPQTPGELRTRTQRLCEFGDVADVELVLNTLASHEDGPYVVKLSREPGKREARYAHLFCGEVSDTAPVQPALQSYEREERGGGQQSSEIDSRVDALEERLEQAMKEIAELRELLNEVL